MKELGRNLFTPDPEKITRLAGAINTLFPERAGEPGLAE